MISEKNILYLFPIDSNAHKKQKIKNKNKTQGGFSGEDL
jgi:hypothetical protein